jgi:hypothetical protein
MAATVCQIDHSDRTNYYGCVILRTRYPRMSALGQKRTLTRAQPTSALPPKADIARKRHSSRCHNPGGIFLTKPSSFFSSHARSSAARAFAALVDDMRTKTDQIRAAWGSGNRIGALRVAARFFDRSTATKTFQRGMDANNHPGFYRQLGKEPQELVAAALRLLQKRFDLR